MRYRDLSNNFKIPNYGLKKGDSIKIKFKPENKHSEAKTQICTVIGEYRDYITIKGERYNKTIQKVDMLTKDVEVWKRSGKQWNSLG